MNRVFRVIWNEVLSSWTAVPEMARSHGSSASVVCAGPLLFGALFAVSLPAAAACSGGAVIVCDNVGVQATTVGAGPTSPAGTSMELLPGAQVDTGDATAISVGDNAAIVLRAGSIVGNAAAVNLGNYGTGANAIEFNSGTTLTIEAGAQVRSTGTQWEGEAVNAMGGGNRIVNSGTISADNADATLWLEATSGTNTIVNTATGVINGSGATGEILGVSGTMAVDFTNQGSLVGNLSFADGNDILRWSTGATITGAIAAGGGANLLILNGAGTDTFSQTISGFQSLEKQDAGTWTLNISLPGSGITSTLVREGTLILGTDASGYTGSMGVLAPGILQSSAQFAPLAITNDGLVRFAQPTDAGYAGLITGPGGIEKTGAGRLTLLQDQAFTGTTTISAGILQLGNGGTSGAVLGDIVNNAALEIDRSNALTLGGAISGSGTVSQIGSGITTLAGGNSYGGATTVAAGTLRAGAANTFSPNSAHGVAAGASLDLAGFSQTVASLNNSGTVSLLGATPGTTLTVNGPYLGNNALLRIGTALGDSSSASDRLILNGPTAVAGGSTRIQVTNLGGLGAQTTGNGIEVVTALSGATTTAQTTKSAFALAGNGHVDAGAFEYRLYAADAAGAGENWYLRSSTTVTLPGPVPAPVRPAPSSAPAQEPAPTPASISLPTYRAEVPLLSAMPAQLRQGSLAMLGNLHQRIGDEDPGAGAGPAGAQRRAWARVIGADIDIRQNGIASPRSEGRLKGLQAGTDLWAAADWRAGVYVGRLEGDIDVSGFARGAFGRVGHNDLRSDYLGGYATYTHASGFYADAVLQAGRHRYSVLPLANLPASGKADSRLASIEVGQSFPIGERWKIEPQLQLIYQRLSFDDMAIAGALVQQQADNGWMARAGLRLKGEFATGAGTLQPYARANFYRAGSGSDVARFIGPAGSTDIASSTGHSTAEVAAGATLTLNPRASLYGEVGKLIALGGDSRVKSGVQGSVGLRVRW